MKVYLVWQGEYEDRTVVRVTKTFEAGIAYLLTVPNGYPGYISDATGERRVRGNAVEGKWRRRLVEGWEEVGSVQEVEVEE